MFRIRRLLPALLLLANCKAKVEPCDPIALAKAVDTVEGKRNAHPAWYRDPTGGSLSTGLLLDQLANACPALPPDLQHQLDLHASFIGRGGTLDQPPSAIVNAYTARRDAICNDPSVFSELGSLAPELRGEAVYTRCGFDDDYPIESRLGDAYDVGFVFIPIFRKYLVDTGIDPELARRTVELFGFPYRRGQTQGQHPTVPITRYPLPLGGLLIRATPTALLPIDGPETPLDAPKDGLVAWVEAQTPTGVEGLPLVLDFDGSLPAAAVAAVVGLDGAPRVDLLTQDEHGETGSVLFQVSRADERPLSLSMKDGTVTILDGAGSSSFSGSLEHLSRWAAEAEPPPSVRIACQELDVQGLVDIVGALVGPGCEMDRPNAGLPDAVGSEACTAIRYSLAL